jgi:hypothetical protein
VLQEAAVAAVAAALHHQGRAPRHQIGLHQLGEQIAGGHALHEPLAADAAAHEPAGSHRRPQGGVPARSQAEIVSACAGGDIHGVIALKLCLCDLRAKVEIRGQEPGELFFETASKRKNAGSSLSARPALHAVEHADGVFFRERARAQ